MFSFRLLLCTFLVSLAIVCLAFPYIITNQLIKNLSNTTSYHLLIGYTSVVVFFLLYFYKFPTTTFIKLKNTYKLKNASIPPLYFIVLVLFSAVLSGIFLIFKKHYIPTYSIEFLSFAIINVIIIFIWIAQIFPQLFNKEEKTRLGDSNQYLFSDEPRNPRKSDLLGRGTFVKKLTNEIINLNFNHSFIYGLYGNWGEGKTSILLDLIDKLESEEDIIVVSFNPWHYNNERAVLNGFYMQIENALNKHFIFTDIHNTFKKYKNIIISGIAKSLINYELPIIFKEDETFEKINSTIKDYIEKTNKKLVITIDDIDRLEFNELLFVFKLVRNNSNFSNTVYILSFDPVEVKNRFRLTTSYKDNFIDKIINKPVKIPEIENEKIKEYLISNIIEIAQKNNIPDDTRSEFREIFQKTYDLVLKNLFRNLRDVKRFLNEYISTLEIIDANEIYFYDFVLIEIIKVFFPEVYNDIWMYPWIYNFHGEKAWDNERVLYDALRNDLNSEGAIRKHINELILEENKREIIIIILSEMFFDIYSAFISDISLIDKTAKSKQNEENKRISSLTYFENYFTLTTIK